MNWREIKEWVLAGLIILAVAALGWKTGHITGYKRGITHFYEGKIKCIEVERNRTECFKLKEKQNESLSTT